MVQPLSYLSDAFEWLPWKWDVLRNDEMSGSGDGRYWTAELAPPLWKADVVSRRMSNTKAEELDAALRYLVATREPFLMANPVFCGPKADPTGAILGAAAVTLSAIGAAPRMSVSFAGLPAGYVLTRGDKISAAYGTDKTYFGEISATVTANSGGAAASVPVFPPIPLGLSAGAAVTLIKPACPVTIQPKSIAVSEIVGSGSSGTSFTIIQKK